MVGDGDIHWFIAGGRGGLLGRGRSAAQITDWVTDSFPVTTIDGLTLYDLSSLPS
jgi:hypothetical protein